MYFSIKTLQKNVCHISSKKSFLFNQQIVEIRITKFIK